MRSFLRRGWRALALACAAILLPPAALAQHAGKIGVVLMHGKGGAPTRLISELVPPLEAQGFLVANLDMPWSGRRQYDVPVAAANAEVDAALNDLRQRGADRVFVAGHSQGGLFGLQFGGRHRVDGIIAIAPGGNVGNDFFRQKLGATVAQARDRIAAGQGSEVTELADIEGSQGTFPVRTTPNIYLTWFDPNGAMNQEQALRAMNPATPVLYIAPTRDYPALLKNNGRLFSLLPRHPQTRLAEPEATHQRAPGASAALIIDWITGVAAAR